MSRPGAKIREGGPGVRILLLSVIAIGAAGCAPLVPDQGPPPAPPPTAGAPAPAPMAAAAPGPAASGFPFWTTPQPRRLALSNFSFDYATVQTVVTTAPECGTSAAAVSTFALPLNGTRVIEAPPGADVCWRREIAEAPSARPRWSEWNRAYLSAGRSIDSQL